MSPSSSRDALQRTALRLFRERGYETVTVAAITQAVGVSHMTFFRHFPTKESVVVGDLFDPAIADAVSVQPPDDPPLHRTVNGLRTALTLPEAAAELGSPAFADRIRLIAGTPSLRGAARASSEATEEAILRALIGTGSAPPAARAAAGAVMGAATAILLDERTLSSPDGPAYALAEGLGSLIGPPR